MRSSAVMAPFQGTASCNPWRSGSAGPPRCRASRPVEGTSLAGGNPRGFKPGFLRGKWKSHKRQRCKNQWKTSKDNSFVVGPGLLLPTGASRDLVTFSRRRVHVGSILLMWQQRDHFRGSDKSWETAQKDGKEATIMLQTTPRYTARITPWVKRTIFFFSTLRTQTPLVRAFKLEVMFWCSKFYWELHIMFSILTAFWHYKDGFFNLPTTFVLHAWIKGVFWSVCFPIHFHPTRALLALSEAAPESLLPRIVAAAIGKSIWELLDANHRGALHSHELAANSLKLSIFGLSTVRLPFQAVFHQVGLFEWTLFVGEPHCNASTCDPQLHVSIQNCHPHKWRSFLLPLKKLCTAASTLRSELSFQSPGDCQELWQPVQEGTPLQLHPWSEPPEASRAPQRISNFFEFLLMAVLHFGNLIRK